MKKRFNALVILPLTPLRWWLSLVAMSVVLLWVVVVSQLSLLPGAGESIKFIGYFVLCIFTMLVCIRPLSRWHFGLHGSAPSQAGGQANPSWFRVAIITVIAVVLMLTVAEVFTQSSHDAKNSTIQVFQSLGFGQSLSNDIWIALGVTVFAPLGEELLFRVLIMRSLYDGLRQLRNKQLSWLANPVLALMIAVLLSSLAFADSHGGEGQDIQFYVLTFMGIVFALSYAMSGSLFAPVLAHSLNNSISLLMIIWIMPANMISTPAQITIWAGPVITFLILLTLRKILRH